jgi:hypothetical protein
VPDLRHPDIPMEGLRFNGALDRDFESGPPENEALNRNASSCALNGDHLMSCGLGVACLSRHIPEACKQQRHELLSRPQNVMRLHIDWAGMQSSRRR